MRLPTVLIAAPQLGGISTTLSAYESLRLRGFDIDAVLCTKEDYYENWRYLSAWFEKRGIHFATLEPPGPMLPDPAEDEQQMKDYYKKLTQNQEEIPGVVAYLQQAHARRLEALDAAPQEARDHFWWPFLQHQHIRSNSQVMNIDSAHKDHFETYALEPTSPKSVSLLQPTMDGSASWWTQCLGHSNSELALAAAYAAGRYGHVIFPQSVYEPALNLAKRLVTTVGRGWASKVFFSDDGSTGMEVALKMALRAYSKRFDVKQEQRPELGVLGLKGSYHGDTIGAMDASEKSVYSKSVEWYKGRGFWLDPPTVGLSQGQATITFDGPQWNDRPSTSFESLSSIYDVESRIGSELADVYRQHILALLKQATSSQEEPLRLGALVLEPVIMGAGGMLFVDPLFQRMLVDVVRSREAGEVLGLPPQTSDSQQGWSNLPVVFDEVFTGLHRVGPLTASDLLGCKPDVACFAKILTGGLVPMSVTLATQEMYDTFLGETKVEALLHGHSYTAHPVGCAVANCTLELLEQLEFSPSQKQWQSPNSSSAAGDAAKATNWSLWDRSVVEQLSKVPSVESAMALGCVLSIKLVNTSETQGKSLVHCRLCFSTAHSECALGYSATLGADFLANKLRPELQENAGFDIHTRPLGDVLYVMCSLNTSRATLAKIEAGLLKALTQ